MKLAGKIFLVLLVSVVLLIAALFFYSDRIITGMVLEKRYNLDITYKRSSKDISGEFSFDDLSVVSRSTALGFTAKKAILKPSLAGKNITLDFSLHNVTFIKKATGEALKYDTLTALVSSPFNSKWNYTEIRGRLEPGKESVKIDNLEAMSDQIRLSLKGTYFYSGIIDSDIVIYFASQLTKDIPPEFASVVLTGEKDGWKSLSVRLTGDPNKPSIQVSSKLFRLTIKSASGS